MIKVQNISFSYPTDENCEHYVLENVSLDIHPGESIAVMGHNGSGKTTFARCLNGLLLPTKGRVVVDGKDTQKPEFAIEIKKCVGMVFQNPDNQIVSATVEREIAFGLENLGVSYQEMHRIVDEMLLKFHLDLHRRKSPHYISGGEKQRLALASVMAMQPRYLVLDEPTSLLDPKSRNEIMDILENIHGHAKENPITTILITQFPEEALFADRLIIFHDGQIVMDDNPNRIFQNDKALTDIGLEPPASIKVTNILKSLI